ncbi:MAG: DNA repair exonuclease [Berryella intestinalis]|uniref:metallophosphoesterase family protein n=1 Tax=Berryella intestinalis TaxID=1531429 RepID=UPI002A5345F3|nr:DNA repair exonuclease [Berryella intestinalis]MDD7369756.1 DNA repair exonuclease [Berryella intestinalis]MDY3128870.1 DNA repair exonuclease [Berryella intestinalis]
MARSITFLHTADLHFGAPFRGIRNLSETWSDRLLEAIGSAYDTVIDTAIKREVDFVVIAGDVFDTARASYRDYRRFFDGLHRLDRAGVPVYLCTGNHDPYTSWQADFERLPRNVVMFEAAHPSFALYERDGEALCLLGGRSYFNQTWPRDQRISEGIDRASLERNLERQTGRPDLSRVQAPFSVGVIHTGLTLDPLKAPENPLDLMACGIDYWACGHIHSRYAYPSWDDPSIVFPGCIQGRDANETGSRGCVLVTLTEGAANRVEFVPTASIDWERLSVDVSSSETVSDIERRITEELFRANGRAQCSRMIARVELVGTTDLHDLLCQKDILEDVRLRLSDTYDEFFVDALSNRTRKPRDLERSGGEALFATEFARAAARRREDLPSLRAEVEEELVARRLGPSAAKALTDELCDESMHFVLDLLDRGSQR